MNGFFRPAAVVSISGGSAATAEHLDLSIFSAISHEERNG
jgi:hypothetical protein